MSSHDQNKKFIHSCFEEKLNKAIHDTKQIAMKLSDACNQVPALQFHAPVPYLPHISAPTTSTRPM
eukprot:13830041-Ditylum_brightwellii.AAC.1